MNKTRTLVLGGLMACLAALFQCLPVFLTEAFVILTMLSALPIYIISKIEPRIGMVALIVSFILIAFFSTHEALFFICTNGPVGAALGILSRHENKLWVVLSGSSFVMTISLCVMNFLIGIPIFGAPIPGTLIIQLLILIVFSVIYTFFYFYFCRIIFNKIIRVFSD